MKLLLHSLTNHVGTVQRSLQRCICYSVLHFAAHVANLCFIIRYFSLVSVEWVNTFLSDDITSR